jgi:polyisoprenoid-binding protein YceI
MKTNRLDQTPNLLLAVVLGLAVNAASAADLLRYVAPPGSQVKMDGTSTIHDWTCIGKIIGGSIEVDPSFDGDAFPKTPKVQPKVDVNIPVRSLKSQVHLGASKMDQVMQTHMKMTNHTQIKYQLIELVGKGDAESGKKMQYDAKGALTVAGVTQTNTMPVTFERVDAKTIKVSGNTPLKMTDFDIKPPAPTILGMSTIKTGDEVKISFEWVLAK